MTVDVSGSSPIAGSPFALPNNGYGGSVVIDPTGEFMYVGGFDYPGGNQDYLQNHLGLIRHWCPSSSALGGSALAQNRRALALVCRLTEEDRREVKSVLRVHCGATIFAGPSTFDSLRVV